MMAKEGGAKKIMPNNNGYGGSWKIPLNARLHVWA